MPGSQAYWAANVLKALREGGWPEVLSWHARSVLAARAGVALPDLDAMTLVAAADELAAAPHLLPKAYWSQRP